jgi:uncharacterized membrane protein
MRERRSRLAVALGVVGVIGLGISLYLSWTKLTGALPICGPSGGCETVDSSPYSVVAGIPVALFGVLNSAAVVVLAAWWARTRSRRAAYGAYALGLTGTLIEAYLVYLELFVIHAICIWCVAYGITVVLGFAIAVLMVRAAD